nr:ankyrin repeat domain-containing protein [uncultured Fretibacterium sp.]
MKRGKDVLTMMKRAIACGVLLLGFLWGPSPLYAALSDAEFIELCQKDDVQAVKAALEGGANPNAHDAYGWTALHRVTENASLLLELIKAGADVNAQSKDGRTPLMLAAVRGQEVVLSELLRAGAQVDAQDTWGATPLIYAAYHKKKSFQTERNPMTLVLLLRAGADVNAQTKDGVTALMAAIDRENTWAMEDLCRNGADVNLQDAAGQTALIRAVRGRHIAMATELLRAGADADIRDKRGWTALGLAREIGRECKAEERMNPNEYAELLQPFSSALNSDEFVALCRTGTSADVVAAVKGGANIETWDFFGNTAHAALLAEAESLAKESGWGEKSRNTQEFMEHLKKAGLYDAWLDIGEKEDIVYGASISRREFGDICSATRDIPDSSFKELVSLRADPNGLYRSRRATTWQPEIKTTALIEAAKMGQSNRVALLLDAEPLMDLGGINKLALFEAAVAENGAVATLEVLLRKGFRANTKNDDGDTLLMKAAERYRSEAVEFLLKANGVKWQNDDLERALRRMFDDKWILYYDAGVLQYMNSADQVAYKERRALDKRRTLKLLLDAGADINAETNKAQGWVFLNKADARNWRDPVLLLAVDKGDVDLLKGLLEVGTNLNLDIRGEYEDTALIRALKEDKADIAKLLLEAGADPNLQNKEGDTALILVSGKGKTDIAKLLLEAKADPNLKNEDGNTALIQAVKKGKADIVKLLLEAKANLNLQYKYGNTALIQAVEKEKADIVKLLLEAGADVGKKDQDGLTAMEVARRKGNEEIIRLFDAM